MYLQSKERNIKDQDDKKSKGYKLYKQKLKKTKHTSKIKSFINSGNKKGKQQIFKNLIRKTKTGKNVRSADSGKQRRKNNQKSRIKTGSQIQIRRHGPTSFDCTICILCTKQRSESKKVPEWTHTYSKYKK